MPAAELITQCPKQLRSQWVRPAGVWLRSLIKKHAVSWSLQLGVTFGCSLPQPLAFVLLSSPDFCWHWAIFFLKSLSWASTLAYDFFGLWTSLILDFNWPLSVLLFSPWVCLFLSFSVFLPLVTMTVAPDSYSLLKNLLVSWKTWSGKINCALSLCVFLWFQLFFLCMGKFSHYHWLVWQITLDFCDLNIATRGNVILFACLLVFTYTLSFPEHARSVCFGRR